MIRLTALLFLFLLIEWSSTLAQCTFTPTVIPSQPILCPNVSDTLWTQEYEAYQWYKNNNAIAGATNQYHVVAQNDILKQFKVAATMEGCTENSASVLVDGWVFLLPYVIQSGDLGTFDPNTQSFILCPGDTMILEMGQPYIDNVQWFDNGNPISGANNSIYYVTSSGSYTACGAPTVCPDYLDCMLIPIEVTFSTTPAPVITQSNDTLFSTTAISYQWFLNNNIIPGATSKYYVPAVSGSYNVSITNNFDCNLFSATYNYIATGSLSDNVAPFTFSIFPNPAHDILTVFIRNATPDAFAVTVTDIFGKTVSSPLKSSGAANKIIFDTGKLTAGNYLVRISNSKQVVYEKLVVY
jgi:hypothetical protein